MADSGWSEVILLTLRETPAKPKDGVERPGEGYGQWVVARFWPDGRLFKVTLRAGQYRPSKIDGSKTLPKDGLDYYNLMDLRKPSKVNIDPVKKCECGATRAPTVWEDVVFLMNPRNPPKRPEPIAPAGDAQETDDENPFA